MAITRLAVTNFKSFDHLDIELGKFSVIVGRNASGKSNFVEIFRFLKDIERNGLENALSMHGGSKYVRNIEIGTSKPLSFDLTISREFSFVVPGGSGFVLVQGNELRYSFRVLFDQEGEKYSIEHDQLEGQVRLYRLKPMNENRFLEKLDELAEGSATVSRSAAGVSLELDVSPKIDQVDTVFPASPLANVISPESLLIEHALSPFIGTLKAELKGMSTFDFDPKLPKKAFPMSGKLDLEENGENLALVLKNIVDDETRRRQISNLLSDLIPFVQRISVGTIGDSSLLFKLEEAFSKKNPFPASLLSDGTINLVAIIVALYFTDNGLTIIEEPERNIHPLLLSRIVAMAKEVSGKKQVIVTTHSPGVVKSADLESILLVSRDKKGYSKLTRPGDSKEVAIFLKNEIGVGDLFERDLLGV